MKRQGFIDVDWAGGPSNRKIRSGGIISIGSAVVSWYNRKHILVALSSTEVEYMATIQAACDTIWVRKIIVILFG